jgi:hypothetical protein
LLQHPVPPKPESAIIGKWQQIGGNVTFEFLKDGTVLFGEEVNEMQWVGPSKLVRKQCVGKYTFIDDGRIKMEMGGPCALAGPIVGSVVVKGGKLDVIDQVGGDGHFERVK